MTERLNVTELIILISIYINRDLGSWSPAGIT